jgi:hypothetical protein
MVMAWRESSDNTPLNARLKQQARAVLRKSRASLAVLWPPLAVCSGSGQFMWFF